MIRPILSNRKFCSNIGIFFLAVSLLLTGCASLELVPQNQEVPSQTHPSPLNLQNYETLHFVLKGRDISKLYNIGEICEDIYKKIMFDTNLFSFKPKQNYVLVIYRDQLEYHSDTGYPLWSGGGTVTELAGRLLPSERETKARTSIYTFENAVTSPLLAHEISHLVFNEFMAFENAVTSNRTLWLNEGLATYEELEWYNKTEQEEFLKVVQPLIKQHAIPLEKTVEIKPFDETERTLGNYFYRGASYFFTNISIWYWQVSSVTRFLITKHGQYNFYHFLNALKEGKNLDFALAIGYPGKWKNIQELETDWKESLR